MQVTSISSHFEYTKLSLMFSVITGNNMVGTLRVGYISGSKNPIYPWFLGVLHVTSCHFGGQGMAKIDDGTQLIQVPRAVMIGGSCECNTNGWSPWIVCPGFGY